ncbi:hypothetical protein ABZ464_49755 [Streptomyces sp. NPDC005820]|uniref:hypothetical protein n=1 Tax=Streptomyces sp. NPDC005820 TaxID=3157069 RepID=UPI0033FDD7CD
MPFWVASWAALEIPSQLFSRSMPVASMLLLTLDDVPGYHFWLPLIAWLMR